MVRDVRVHLLPVLFEPEEVRGGIAVVLDILRASTTIVHALANGARSVIPVSEIDEAFETAGQFSHQDVLLGGEREGLLIEGFHLDNNPFAYSREVVSNQTIIFTTSNGTRALLRAIQADRILIGSFVNLHAVVRVIADDSRPIHLVCAGTKGKITTEDCLCAGAIVHRLIAACGIGDDVWQDDQLRMALDLYRQEAITPEALRRAMHSGYGGRNCTRLGFQDQIDRASELDLYDIVPEFDKNTKSLRI